MIRRFVPGCLVVLFVLACGAQKPAAPQLDDTAKCAVPASQKDGQTSGLGGDGVAGSMPPVSDPCGLDGHDPAGTATGGDDSNLDVPLHP